MQMQASGPGVISRPDQIPLSYLIRTHEVLCEQGWDISPFLDAAKLPRSLLHGTDSGEYLSSNDYYALMDCVLQEVDIPALGVQVGRKFSTVDYGVLGYAFISSPTLLQALSTFFRFQEIVGSGTMFEESLRVTDDAGIISVKCQAPSARLSQFEVEESFGQWLSMAQSVQMSSGALQFTRIHFAFPEPGYLDLYQELFKCQVYCNQPENEIHFPRESLDQRFTMADQITAQLCEQQCDAILQKLQDQGGLVEQVRRLIINQPGETPDPEEVARKLNISYRTMRRRLSEEGTSFKDIHNEVRMGMATEYLRETDLSTQEIAFLLGYSEVTNFHRAFKKWAQLTPGEYRDSERID